MRNLDELRLEIDRVDRQLLELFEERMGLCSEVADYKLAMGLQVLDAEREKRLLDEKLKMTKTPELKAEVYDFFDSMMAISRELQAKRLSKKCDNGVIADIINKKRQRKEKPRVCCFGARGSYSEVAAVDYFGKDADRFCQDTFSGVLEALKEKRADYSVVPIENSSTGAIAEVMDLLEKYDYYIVGEVVLPIHHCLLGKKGTKLTDVKTVISHEQGILQSQNFLKELGDVSLEVCHSTAQGAEQVAKSADNTVVAIAGKQNAEIYGLEVLAENINSSAVNTTRFVIISRHPEIDEECDKISIACTLRHESGSLYRLLSCFARGGLNLLKLESRPIPSRRFEYMFFMDYSGNLLETNVKEVTNSIIEGTQKFKLLGNYRAGKMED